MENTEDTRKKPGPVPGPKTERYQVLLIEKYAEWAKHQPGGLSEVLRELLKKAYEEANKNEQTP